MNALEHAPLERRINRTILLAVDDGAASSAVVHQTIALSHAVVADALPLCIIDMAQNTGRRCDDACDEEALAQRFSAACDMLASAALAAALRQQGIAIAFEDDLHVWLVVDLADENFRAVAAAEALRLLTEIAWRRVRMTVIPHLFLLAEPEQQERMGEWADELANQCGGQIFLAGAINQQHLRLSDENWREEAAIALTTLLWVHTPSYSALAQSAHSGVCFYAVGAVLWPAPRNLLRRWCEQWWVGAVVERLGRAAQREPADQFQALVQGLKLSEQEIAAVVPGTLPAATLRNWRPGWGNLATASDSLLARANRRDEQRRQEQERARLAWLGQRLQQWEEALTRRAAGRLTPQQRWPMLTLWRAELADLRQRLQTECAQVDGQLEAANQRLAIAEGALAHETRILQGLCNSFPVNSLAGLLALAVQPWRWPGWLWRYLVVLPRQAQRLLIVLAQRNHHAGWEANLHTLRQLGLAAAQDVRLCTAQLDALCTLLAEMATLVESTLADMQAQTRPPWTSTRLARLCPLLIGNGEALAWELFERHPLPGWAEGGASDAVEKAIDHVAAALGILDGASAPTLLALAFAPAVRTPDGEAQEVGNWLSECYLAAAPLWPASEDQHALYGEAWLSTPGPSPAGVNDPLGGVGLEEISAWVGAQPDVMAVEGAMDGIGLLRWTRVVPDFQ